MRSEPVPIGRIWRGGFAIDQALLSLAVACQRYGTGTPTTPPQIRLARGEELVIALDCRGILTLTRFRAAGDTPDARATPGARTRLSGARGVQ